MNCPLPSVSLLRRGTLSLCLAAALVALSAQSRTIVITTTNVAEAAAFLRGATIETFDDHLSQAITNYDPGQIIVGAAQFSSRDGITKPTFHCGGGSIADPTGTPGTPIGIVRPSGPIANDVISKNNVAAPLVINSEELFNKGFMEIIFPVQVSRVGFWVTHGTVSWQARDGNGSNIDIRKIGDGSDDAIVGQAGEFVGISFDRAVIKVAAMLGSEAFTIDDVGYVEGPFLPPNDSATNAFVLAPGGDLVNDDMNTSPDGLWYSWTPVEERPFDVTTFGSVIGTRLELYTGAPAQLTLVASDALFPFDATRARVTFWPQAGTRYLIRVSSYTGELGPIMLGVEAYAPPRMNSLTPYLDAVDPLAFFAIRGAAGVNTVMESSADLHTWTPAWTNSLDGYDYDTPFSDYGVTNQPPHRFYRARYQRP